MPIHAHRPPLVLAAALPLALFGAAGAQTTDGAAEPSTAGSAGPSTAARAAREAGEDSLKIFFDTGSARVSGEGVMALDQAARLYRDASPFLMVVSGGADTVGAADDNLDLSVRRARAVADGLMARGIPADRLQVLGRGLSELEVPTGPGTPERQNRVVEITWLVDEQG